MNIEVTIKIKLSEKSEFSRINLIDELAKIIEEKPDEIRIMQIDKL